MTNKYLNPKDVKPRKRTSNKSINNQTKAIDKNLKKVGDLQEKFNKESEQTLSGRKRKANVSRKLLFPLTAILRPKGKTRKTNKGLSGGMDRLSLDREDTNTKNGDLAAMAKKKINNNGSKENAINDDTNANTDTNTNTNLKPTIKAGKKFTPLLAAAIQAEIVRLASRGYTERQIVVMIPRSKCLIDMLLDAETKDLYVDNLSINEQPPGYLAAVAAASECLRLSRTTVNYYINRAYENYYTIMQKSILDQKLAALTTLNSMKIHLYNDLDKSRKVKVKKKINISEGVKPMPVFLPGNSGSTIEQHPFFEKQIAIELEGIDNGYEMVNSSNELSKESFMVKRDPVEDVADPRIMKVILDVEKLSAGIMGIIKGNNGMGKNGEINELGEQTGMGNVTSIAKGIVNVDLSIWDKALSIKDNPAMANDEGYFDVEIENLVESDSNNRGGSKGNGSTNSSLNQQASKPSRLGKNIDEVQKELLIESELELIEALDKLMVEDESE